jgi:hypothetical protein
VVDGLSVDGLVQRRRTRLPDDPPPGDPPPADLPAADPPPDRPAASAPDDGLPRRVRQASIAPQLRVPLVEPTTAPARSPEQVRSLMSALQWGTNRGRLVAAGIDVDAEQPAPEQRGDAAGLAEAATVTIPAVRGHGAPDDGPGAAGDPETMDAAGGTAPDEDQVNRPDKDA